MNDRIIKILSFMLAVCLHLTLLYFGSHQYQAASTNPDRANAAARALMGAREKPVKFIYVKDTERSKEPPVDRSRVSDVQRRGASPDGGKGRSPDPTSLGNAFTRELGGAGRNAPTPQQAHPPSPRGGATAPPQPGSQGSQGQGAGKSSAAQPESPGAGRTSLPAQGAGKRPLAQPEASGAGRTTPPAPGGGSPSAARAPTPGLPPQPQGAGVGGQLQQMYMGAMKGGFHNPNASKLNSGTVSFDTAEWDLGPYARQVQERVQSNWRIPEAQEILRQKGWVSIHFVVHKDGQVTDLAVVRPSGIPSYDQAAVNALRTSSPLPPLPAEVTVQQIAGTFRFFYNMAILDEDE